MIRNFPSLPLPTTVDTPSLYRRNSVIHCRRVVIVRIEQQLGIKRKTVACRARLAMIPPE
jgi:hypothetical protein